MLIKTLVTFIILLSLASAAETPPYVHPTDPKCRYLYTDQDAQECMSKKDYTAYIKRKNEVAEKRRNTPRKKSPAQIIREEREEHMKFKVNPLNKPKTVEIKN